MATNKNITMKQFNGTDYDTLYPKTKVEQVEGAYSQQQILADSTKAMLGFGADAVPDDLFKTLGAELIVTTEAGTVVTASRNGKTVIATSNSSGLAVLKIPEFGTWTVSATINGVSISIDYEIKAIAQYELGLTTDLETASWAVIDFISKSGNAASVWSVGDKKTIKLNGISYTAQIIGFNHDTKTSGDKAGITFQLVDCLNDSYPMNNHNINHGGWKSSEMRYYMSKYLVQLDEDLQSAIKAVNKKTSAGDKSSSINTTSDKLFLLSEVEIFGSATLSFAGEGSQYDWYKAGNTKVKKIRGSAFSWWNRSPSRSSNEYFCAVADDGKAGYITADYSVGVSFAFCV